MSELQREYKRRLDAARRLPPLDHIPGDVRDPLELEHRREPKATAFGMQEYRQWWLDNEGKPHIQRQIETMVNATRWYA